MRATGPNESMRRHARNEGERMKRILFLMMIVLFSEISMAASPPPLLNYQGILRNSSKAPLTGTFAMTFRFYSLPTGGSDILVDQHPAVQVTGGLFNVELGSGTITDGSSPGFYTSLPAVFRDFTDVYLSVQVASDVLTPRVRILSSAHALNSDYLDGLNSDEFPRLSIPNLFSTGNQVIQTGSPTNNGLVIQGMSGQSANLQEWRSSIGTIVASISPEGELRGTGLGIKQLSANELSVGLVPSARILGEYTGIIGVGRLRTGKWNADPIDMANGGTGLTSYTPGDMLYAGINDALTFKKLPLGSAGQVLRSNGSVPEWADLTLNDLPGTFLNKNSSDVSSLDVPAGWFLYQFIQTDTNSASSQRSILHLWDKTTTPSNNDLLLLGTQGNQDHLFLFSSGMIKTLSDGPYGIYTQAASNAIYAEVTDTNSGTAIYGTTKADSGVAILGDSTNTTGPSISVYGRNSSDGGIGVYGHETSTAGGTYGVIGNVASTSGVGVFGAATAGTGTTYGVFGTVNSTDGWGLGTDASAFVQKNMKIGGDLYFDSGSKTPHSMYFRDKYNDPTGASFSWDNANQRFHMTSPLKLDSSLETSSVAFTDNTPHGIISNRDIDLIINSGALPGDNNYIRFYHTPFFDLQYRLGDLSEKGDLRLRGSVTENYGWGVSMPFINNGNASVGDLVSIDSSSPNGVKRTTMSNSSLAVGFVADQPGIVVGGAPFDEAGLKSRWGQDLYQKFQERKEKIRDGILVRRNQSLQNLSGSSLDTLNVDVLDQFFRDNFVNVTTQGRAIVNAAGPVKAGDALEVGFQPGTVQKARQNHRVVAIALRDSVSGKVEVWITLGVQTVAPSSTTPQQVDNEKEEVSPNSVNTSIDEARADAQSTNQISYNAGAFTKHGVAEVVPMASDVEVGDVVVASRENPGSAIRSNIAEDRAVMGVAVIDSGVQLGSSPQEKQMAVAISGIVLCKVDATYRPIEVGDLLVTSTMPGFASGASNPLPGTLLGKALEPLRTGQALVHVLVTLH